jgi:membrane-associated phospholipid phosphatase
MKRLILGCAAALALISVSIAPGAAQEATLVFDPLIDGCALALGAGGSLGTKLALGGGASNFVAPDASELSGLDRELSFPYSSSLDKASLGVEGVILLYPALFALIGEREEYPGAAASYAEALLYTYAAKNCIKYLFPKARPYTYHDSDLSGELLEEATESFPSGHTALAFAAATSFAVMSLRAAQDAPATPWLVAGAYVLAAGEGALRVACGEHFLGDVAAGAALGAGIGYLATTLHLRPRSGAGGEAKGLSAGLSGSGFVLRIAL